MADSKITALASIGTGTDPANDPLVIVDVSDVSPGGMSATGTTKKVTLNNLLACSPTATLASATISGALTVGTGANAAVLKASFLGGYSVFENSAGTGNPSITFNNDLDTGIRAPSANTLVFDAGGFEQYRIASSGVFTWSDGAGGTRMTLNSTGLGVGVSPSYKLDVRGSDNSVIAQFGGTNRQVRFVTAANGGFDNANFIVRHDSSVGGFLWQNNNGSNTLLTIDSSGNVGIGVTPSAWASNRRALQVGGLAAAALALNGTSNVSEMFFNSFVNTSASNVYAVNGRAGLIDFGSGGFGFSIDSGTQTAGAACNFTRAMTLDASGNLLVGTTSALLNSRLRVKTSSTSSADWGVYVADSADAIMFSIANDGFIYTGTKAASPYNKTSADAANLVVKSDGTLWRSTSSLKYKTDVQTSNRTLADVLKLRPVTYKSKGGNDKVYGGLIAEEVDAAGLDEFVYYGPDGTPDSIHYGNMVSLLVAAIKELTARVQTLETR